MPKYEIELQALPSKYLDVLLPFLNDKTSEDDLHEMILCCYSAWAVSKNSAPARARKQISHYLQEKKQENNTIYNPYRNISLDQCIGNSKRPISDWLNVTDWREWDDFEHQ